MPASKFLIFNTLCADDIRSCSFMIQVVIDYMTGFFRKIILTNNSWHLFGTPNH